MLAEISTLILPYAICGLTHIRVKRDKDGEIYRKSTIGRSSRVVNVYGENVHNGLTNF